MDTAWRTAMSGVLGSLVRGSATVATAWLTQKTANMRDLIHAEIRRRETLYGEFIGECPSSRARRMRTQSRHLERLPRGAQSDARANVRTDVAKGRQSGVIDAGVPTVRSCR